MTEYKMLRIKQSTYKELKQIALNQDCTLIALIEELLTLKQKADADLTGPRAQRSTSLRDSLGGRAHP